MFTGIVEDTGVLERADGRVTVWAHRRFEDCVPGSSVSVSGVCLTVTELRLPPHPDAGRPKWEGVALAFDLSSETMERTSLGSLHEGYEVNLERPATPATRLGGHLVQGHVDGVGQISEIGDSPPGREMRVKLPAGLSRYVVEKGSIAVDGVSLTVTDVNDGEFGVALVPYTLEATTLGMAKVGDPVNLEVDVIAKYVERLMRETT